MSINDNAQTSENSPDELSGTNKLKGIASVSGLKNIIKPELKISSNIAFVDVDDSHLDSLRNQANGFLDKIATVPARSPAYITLIDRIESLGNKQYEDISEGSDKVLAYQLKDNHMENTSHDSVNTAITSLTSLVKDLDVNGIDFTPSGILSIMKKKKVTKYFNRYDDAQNIMNTIVMSLLEGHDIISRENSALEIQRQHTYNSLGELQDYLQLVDILEQETIKRVNAMKEKRIHSDSIKTFESDVLFAVRQKKTDMLTRYAVAEQAYMAMDIIQKNNKQVQKNINQARITVVSALQTSILVAQALSNQKLILDNVDSIMNQADISLKASERSIRKDTSTLDFNNKNDKVNDRVKLISEAMDTLEETKKRLTEFNSNTNHVMDDAIDKLKTQVDKSKKEIKKNIKTSQEEE